MCELDEQHKLKLLPGLKLKDLNPNHFEEKKNGFSSCLVKPQCRCSHKVFCQPAEAPPKGTHNSVVSRSSVSMVLSDDISSNQNCAERLLSTESL